MCEVHFQKHEILWETSFYDSKSGRTVTAPLKKPRLAEGAVPSVFPNCPSYLSSSHGSRESPDERKARLEMEAIQKAVSKSEEENKLFIQERLFKSFEELKSKLNLIELGEFWTLIQRSNSVLFLNLEIEPHVRVKYSVIIDDKLELTAYAGNIKISNLGKFILPMQINSAIKLNDLLNSIKSVQCKEKDSLEVALNVIKDIFIFLKSNLKECSSEKLTFILEQITLLVKKVPYSPDILIFTSLLYHMAPHAYKFLRESGFLTLPHPSTIRRISYPNIEPEKELQDVNFLKYISQKASLLFESDKKIVLLLDEIHVLPCYDFKGGNISGATINNESPATSAHVFMISSLLSTFKDVIQILPVKSIKSDLLTKIMLKIIIGLEKIGFMVIAIITDNSSVNRKSVSNLITPSSLQFVYPHPVDNSRPLFYLVDPVHLFKCIRNNWVNQKNPERCFYYPTFDSEFNDLKDYHTASLDSLERLYASESEDLLKLSFNLSYKALYPSNFEKQNVKLVLQIFNEHVYEGLLVHGSKHEIPHIKDTSSFIKVITTWWKIVNVKSPNAGVRLNNKFQFPLTNSPEDPKNEFLNKFIDWLDRWENMECTTGMLTKETHCALKLTTEALLNLSSYCIDELGMLYILPGKFQTDQLESRFSRYRQMGGAQYHISMRQIYEIEKKIRTQSLLKLNIKTKSFGNLEISHSDLNEEDGIYDRELAISNMDDYSHISMEVSDDDFKNIEDKIPVITYLGGYCARKVLRKLNCVFCKDFFVIQKEFICGLDHALIQGLDRGKLLYPQDIVVKTISYNYIIIQKLCNDFEAEFLKFFNQRHVAVSLTMDILLDTCVFEPEERCENGHLFQEYFKKIIRSSTNTFLNNFCKRKNDSLGNEKRKISCKRKLKTVK